jgi:hypothetical protein
LIGRDASLRCQSWGWRIDPTAFISGRGGALPGAAELIGDCASHLAGLLRDLVEKLVGILEKLIGLVLGILYVAASL